MIQAMEEDQLKRELNIVTLGKLQADREFEQARDKADISEAAQQGFKPSDLKAAERVSKNASDILDAVQEAMENTKVIRSSGTEISASGVTVPKFESVQANESDPMTVKVNGKSINDDGGVTPRRPTARRRKRRIA